MLLKNEIIEIDQMIAYEDRLKTEISIKAIGWHLDHMLKVINGVTKSLKKSNAEKYKWKFNLLRFIFFTFRSFPRGKGKAPRSVISENEIIKEDIIRQLKEAKINLLELDKLDSNNYFKHPYFGSLNLRATKIFMEMHTHHHLKIIKDIIKN